MDKTVNQSVPNYTDKLRQRAMSRFPDRDFTAQSADNGENVLAQSVSEILDEVDARNAENEKHNKQLTDLLARDPRSAEFLNSWMTSGDPITALVENFGDDFMEAMSTPEGKARFVDSHNKWLERKAADDQAAAQRDENWGKSLDDLQAFGDELGLSEQQKVDIILRLHNVAVNAIEGVYTRDDFQMALDAMNYKNDVANARREGEVAGRNARIDQTLRNSRRPEEMPPALVGQGAPASEPRPREKSQADRVKEMFGLK